MDELLQEIRDLVRRIDETVYPRESVEWKARYFLNRVLASGQHATSPDMLTPAVNNLRRFWLESVNWCSQLSRDIEKVVTRHMELVTPDHPSHTEPS